MFHILKLLSALFTQLAALYLVYVLNPTEYGQFALISSIAQLMYILTSGWSSGSVINLGSQSYARTGSYKAVVYYRICIVAVSLVVVSLVFFSLKRYIEGYMKISGMFLYVLMLFLGYVFYDHASQLLYPGNRDRIQAGAEFLATFMLLLGVVFAIHNLKSYILAYTATSILFACVVSLLFLRYFRGHQFQWKYSEFKAVLNYSAWQIIGVISIYIINAGTNYVLVMSHIPLEQIGLYALSYRLYSGFSPFFSLFGILIPKWVHSPNAGDKSVESRLLVIVCVLALLYLASGFALIPLFQIFDMQRYLASIEYFFWLFPAFLLTSYTNLLNTVIANTDRFRSAQTGILLQSGVLVLFGFPLVSHFGVSGALAAITAASAVGAVYFNRNYRKVSTKLGR